MRKLAILLALGVVGSPSLAMAADVVTEVCQVNSSAKQLLTFIEASAGVTLPFSCKGASANCTQCDADLLSEGFKLSKATQSNMNPYFVFTREDRGREGDRGH
jgi:ferredoxin